MVQSDRRGGAAEWVQQRVQMVVCRLLGHADRLVAISPSSRGQCDVADLTPAAEKSVDRSERRSAGWRVVSGGVRGVAALVGDRGWRSTSMEGNRRI